MDKASSKPSMWQRILDLEARARRIEPSQPERTEALNSERSENHRTTSPTINHGFPYLVANHRPDGAFEVITSYETLNDAERSPLGTHVIQTKIEPSKLSRFVGGFVGALIFGTIFGYFIGGLFVGLFGGSLAMYPVGWLFTFLIGSLIGKAMTRRLMTKDVRIVREKVKIVGPKCV